MRDITNMVTSSLVGRLVVGAFIAGALAAIGLIGCAELLLTYAVLK